MLTRPATSLALWGTLAATALTAGLVARWYGRWKNNRPPVKWRRVGELLELTLYPLKSGRGIDLEEADCAELGLRTTDKKPLVLRDRFFLAYNASSGEFVTARGHPKMVLIQVVPREDGDVTFLAPGMPELRVRLPTKGSAVEKRECTMWFNERVETADCGEEAALWMSQYIQGRPGIRLGYHFIPVVPRRRVSVGAWAPFHDVYTSLTDHDTGAYSDLTSFMLMAESSVSDLRSKLPPHLQDITSKRFRPNLVVGGSDPYQEDTWDWVKIGDSAVFKKCKPCTRCVMTTIDPETGVMEPKREPLKTLKTYRQVSDPREKKLEGDAPVMGIYMGLHTPGKIRTGDPVYVGYH